MVTQRRRKRSYHVEDRALKYASDAATAGAVIERGTRPLDSDVVSIRYIYSRGIVVYAKERVVDEERVKVV